MVVHLFINLSKVIDKLLNSVATITYLELLLTSEPLQHDWLEFMEDSLISYKFKVGLFGYQLPSWSASSCFKDLGRTKCGGLHICPHDFGLVQV